MFHISSPQNKPNQIIDFPKSTMKLNLLNMESNLPEQPTFNESKLKETLHENFRFVKSLLYLTKKIFML